MQTRTTLSPEGRAQRDRLDERFLWACAPVMLDIARTVCGCDDGGTSWTTRAEADRMAEELALGPGRRLLDLGAGSGWPGLYMARSTGCEVTLVDLPFNGLKVARDRARADGVSGRSMGLVADAAALPFPDSAFDAISHSDLLCCLIQKRAVLAACRRAIRLGGRMVFTVITVAPGLSPESYRRAVASGPEFIESDSDYPDLLAVTGWKLIDSTDMTAELGASYRRQLEADQVRQDELVTLVGADAYAERIDMWRVKLGAVDDGLLRRARFVAT